MSVSNAAVSVRPSEMSLRYSGHESFFCRTGWCLKLYEYCQKEGSNDDRSLMLDMGIGINMTQSIRFWGEALGLFKVGKNEIGVTEFGEWLLNPDSGFDPYLDTKDGLWLLHWRLCFKARLAAWHGLFFGGKKDIRLSDFTKDVSLISGGKSIVESTIKQHISVLMGMYSVQEKSKSDNDFLIGQLTPLGIVGVMPCIEDTQIKVYPDAADEISSAIWGMIFLDFWKNATPDMKTMSKSFLKNHPQSPLKAVPISPDILSRLLHDMERVTRGGVIYRETLDEQIIHLNAPISSIHKKVVPDGY